MTAPYQHLASLIHERTGSRIGFTNRIQPEAMAITSDRWEGFHHRHSLIRSYQGKLLHLFRTHALCPPSADHDARIRNLLWNDLPPYFQSLQRALPSTLITAPQFFRTDELGDGKIVEVQCPGSLWGIHETVCDYLEAAGEVSPERLSQGFAATVRKNFSNPVIHHLIDDASVPWGVRYFISKTQDLVPYWSYKQGVTIHDCNLVRAHTYMSLIGNGYFPGHLERASEGNLSFDLPPISLFDQKIGTLLPFWRPTRDLFTDDERGLFPYTALLTAEGFADEQGTMRSIADVAQLPRSQRSYVLKYAGCDGAINWGSRAVFALDQLSREACEQLLTQAVEGGLRGRVWIIQSNHAAKETVRFVPQEDQPSSERSEDVAMDAYAKYSGFYGPDGFLGALASHRHYYKVHGQPETIVAPCRPEAP